MPKDGRSFFEKLTGSVRLDGAGPEEPVAELAKSTKHPPTGGWLEPDEEGELTIDMHQTPEEIIIQSMVAGVKPEDLDVTITREMVTLKGKRQSHHEVSEKDFFYRELYWGTFARSVLLPQEVDAERAQATLKNGLLTIKLPRLDKARTQKLKVKSE